MGHVHPTAIIGEAPEHREWRGGVCLRPQVHPSARVGAFVTIDAGLKDPTRVGPRAWLMKHVHIGHDAQVGADCEIAPGTIICGNAKLGRGVKCGVGVRVLPFKTIGDGARLGAGAVVTKHVPAGETWAGCPARCVERPATYDGTLG